MDSKEVQDALNGLVELQEFFVGERCHRHLSAITTVYLITLFFVVICWTASVFSKNYSQVDKLWSITPVINVWVFALMGGANPRLALMAISAAVWGIRLTLNFNRRGGYQWPPWRGEEDYRWAIVQKQFDAKNRPIFWHLFNFGFICCFQLTLLMVISLPAHVAYVHPAAVGPLDYVITFTMVALIVTEGLADQQQYEFQTTKYYLREKNLAFGMFKQGFISDGLFAYCRHPAYTCEQSIWITFYLFGVSASGSYLTYPLAGVLTLMALFQKSGELAEKITSGKYPEYEEYQKHVPMWIPMPKIF